MNCRWAVQLSNLMLLTFDCWLLERGLTARNRSEAKLWRLKRFLSLSLSLVQAAAIPNENLNSCNIQFLPYIFSVSCWCPISSFSRVANMAIHNRREREREPSRNVICHLVFWTEGSSSTQCCSWHGPRVEKRHFENNKIQITMTHKQIYLLIKLNFYLKIAMWKIEMRHKLSKLCCVCGRKLKRERDVAHFQSQ